MKAGSREDGDAPLTPLGEQQAEQLGEFYAPLLMEKAREGKLRLFVSPQMRTCQTAAPLYSRLHQETGIRAAVRVELHEHGPPMHMDNLYAPTPPLPLPLAARAAATKLTRAPPLLCTRPFQREGTKLQAQLTRRVRAGEIEMTTAEIEAAVEAKRETFRDRWTPSGMNAFAFRRKFPWADPPRTNGLDGVPLAEGDAWMNYGPESKARHLLRAESNAEFLRSLQKEMRNDELVVCVSHGAIMGTTVRNARILRACL